MKKLVVCFAAALSLCAEAYPAVSGSERNALLALYNATNGPKWSFNGGWGGAAGSECDWNGVTCDSTNSTVVELYLQANELAGTIPAALGDLSNLQQLQLANNALTGTIPPELGKLSKLQALYLNNNQLSGTIPPSLASLSNLTDLDLDTNNLTGAIPPELGNLSQLQTLSLYDNQLAGTIPAELTHLSKLTYLDIGSNPLTGALPDMSGWPALTFLAMNDAQLSGSIPPSIGQLVNLDQLYLQSNKLTGPIPPQIGNLTKLSVLVLSDNQLSGPLPAEIFAMRNLEDLDLASNQLTGTVSPAIGNLTKLTTLALAYNAFAGTIPDEVMSLSQLDWLDLSGNALTGTVPADLDRLSSVTTVDFSSNQLTGTIPLSIGNMPKLQLIGLGDNQLTGTIPPQIANATALQTIYLYDNQLTGTIPDSFRGLKELKNLSVGSNQLSGPLPDWLGELPKLESFLAGENRFTGPIPASVTSAPNLDYFDVGGNQITGTIPSDIGKLQKLAYLTLEHNEIGGPIPDSFWTLTQLKDVRLAGLDLTGTLPAAIGNLTNVDNFDVEDNALSGPLPPQIGSLTNLVYLSLGGNHFTGTLPRELGQLKNVQSMDLSANDFRSPVPPEIMNMSALVDTGADFSYNALTISDPAVAAWVNLKQFDHDYAHTQTVLPANIAVGQMTDRSAVVSWTPIQYYWDDGGYRVFASLTPNGTPVAVATTSTKEIESITVRGLQPSTTYYFTVATVSHPHDFQHNLIVSDVSAPVQATTGPKQLAPADVVLTATPTGLVELDGVPQNDDSFTLTNFGDVATAITLQLYDSFYDVTPKQFTLAGGASQTVRVTALPNQPPGFYYGGVQPVGDGTSDDDIVTTTLLSAQRAGGVAIAEPVTNRIEIAAAAGIDPVGQVTFKNKGTATLLGVLVADQPWLVPNNSPISIDPGSSATVAFKVMRARRPSGIVNGGLTGTLSLVYVGQLPAGLSAVHASDTTPPPAVSISKVTVVDVSKPDVGPATAPGLGPGEIAYFAAGLLNRTGVSSSLASGLSVVNAFGSKPISDVRLYYSSASEKAVATLSALGSAQGVSLANVVSNVYNPADEIASVQVRSADWQNLLVNANFLRSTGSGTLLGDLPVFRSDRALLANDKLYLTGIAQPANVHAALVLEEIAGNAATLPVDFLDSAGAVAQHRDLQLPAFATNEVTDIPAATATIVISGSGSAAVLAYVRMSDDSSGDTWSVVDWSHAYKYKRTETVRLPLVMRSGSGKRRAVKQSDAVTVRATTSASLFNSGKDEARARISAGSVSKDVTIPVRQTVTISDVGSFVGATSSQSVVIEPKSGEFVVTSRISSGGTGASVPVVSSQSGLRVGQSQVFSGLEDSAAYRTDYGFVETAGSAATIRATLLLSDAHSLFSTVVTRDFKLDANGFIYVNELVRSVLGETRSNYGDLHNLQLQLDVVDGSGSILPFVTMTDNATGDMILRLE